MEPPVWSSYARFTPRRGVRGNTPKGEAPKALLFNRSLARPKGEQPFTKATLLYRPVEQEAPKALARRARFVQAG